MADDRTTETSSSRRGSKKNRNVVAERDLDTSLNLANSKTSDDSSFSNHPHTSELNATADLTSQVTDTSESASMLESVGATTASTPSLEQTVSSGRFSRDEIISNFREYATKASGVIREQAGTLSGNVKTRLKDAPSTGRELVNKVDSSARENPWISIGLAGVGALAIGFLVGRVFSKSPTVSVD